MARAGQAIDGERTFATDAAHELRRPLAVALAQVQRLTAEGPAPERVARIEAALQRMARLLQRARAEGASGRRHGFWTSRPFSTSCRRTAAATPPARPV